MLPTLAEGPTESGAEFNDPSVDSLPPNIKLALLPEEELPTFEFHETIPVRLLTEAPVLPTETLPPANAVVKTADPATVNEGGQSVTYTYELTNTSPASRTPLTLTSLVDDGGTPADTSDDVNLLTAGTFVGGDTDGDGLIDAGETWTYTYTTDVTLNAGASLTNVVTATAVDDEGTSETGTDTATVTATDVLPTLLVTKLVDADGVAGFSDSETISEGTPTTASYQVTIQNTGVEDVTLTSIADDQIANDAALLAAAITANGGAVLVVGASATFTYASDAPLDLDAPDTVVNTVTVNATDDEGNTATDDDTATVTATDVLPTLLVTKLVDADGVAGFSDSETISEGTPTTASYQVTIQNTGVEDVTLTSIADDQIANDAALLAAAITANGGAVLAAGASVTFTYASDAPLDLDAPDTVVNTVTVNATDDEGNTATDDDTATVTATDVLPTLLVTKLVDADGVAGFSDSETISEGTPTTASYQVTIQNTGVEDVTLTSIADDQIANDAALLAAAITANGGAVLAAGASVTFTYASDAPLDLDAPDTVVNTVTVNATDDEGNTATDDDTATVTATDVLPTLLVTKLVDADGVAGFSDSETISEGTPTTASYQVTIQNTGVEDVTLTSIADDQIANDAALLAAAITANGGAVLAAGASVTFTYASDAPLDLDAPDTVVNTVTVNATDDEGNTATDDDTATVTATDVLPTLLVTKLVDADGVAGFSDSETISEGTPTTASYQVTIQNTGVEDVTLTSIADDQIANDAALLAAAITANGGAVLAAGASVTFTYASDAPLDLDAPDTVVNTVTVNATDDEGNTATDDDTATVTATDVLPTLLVTKLVDADGVAGFSDSETISEGTPTTASYQVTIQNTGVEDVTLTSIADDQIANDAALLAAAITANGGAVLAAGASVTFTYASDAPLDLDAPDTVVNTVTVNATDDEGNTATDDDTATVTATDVLPTLLVTKLVDADGVAGFSDSETISEGTPTTASYQVTIQNTGVEDVTLTSIADDQIANDAALLAAAITANGGAVLAAGASVTFTYASDAPLDLDAPDTVVNTVTVNATDDEGNTATDDDTATVTADDIPHPVLEGIFVDEDFLAAGNQDLPSSSPGDGPGSATQTDTITLDFGADAAGATISFLALSGQQVFDTSPAAVQASATNANLYYFWDANPTRSMLRRTQLLPMPRLPQLLPHSSFKSPMRRPALIHSRCCRRSTTPPEPGQPTIPKIPISSCR